MGKTLQQYCFAFEVERLHHVILTLYIVKQDGELGIDALSMFGDDLEAILDVLEDDEGIKK